MYAKITKDLLWEEGDPFPSREGLVIFANGGDPETLLHVRLYDDDGELYYEALADDECLENLFDWTQRDAGVTLLQVCNKDGVWEDTIS